MDYLRSRWYNPANGTFNRIDDYAGNTQEPQSLHKYAYCHGNPINGADPSGNEFSIGNVMTTVSIMGVLTSISNLAITGVGVAFTAEDKDGEPDGVIMSVSEVLGARGFAGEGGFDIIWDLKKHKPYAFLYGAAGLSPITYFKNFNGSHGPSVSIGFVYNMSFIKDWSGTGMTATWPLSTIHLLPKALFSQNKMWGLMTQLAKREHNVRLRDAVIQTQISTSGPAAWKLGVRSNSFMSTGGYTSSPIDLSSVGESLGNLLGPLYPKILALQSVVNNPDKIFDLVE